MGITHRRAVLIIYGVSVVFTAAAIAISFGRVWQVGLALFVASVVLIGLVRFVGYFEMLHGRTRQKARIRSRDTELLRRALPILPAHLEPASSEQEVLDLLGQFCSRARLGAVHIIERSATVEPVRVWEDKEFLRAARHDYVDASFPIGGNESARADFHVWWRTDFGEVSPQSDILLQVVADIAEIHLRRVGSRLAPGEAAVTRGESRTPPVRVTLPDPAA
jgi:UDP-GlcNAc:undecaprenyl-phosphate GlcNAc-1-phosphate transferase